MHIAFQKCIHNISFILLSHSSISKLIRWTATENLSAVDVAAVILLLFLFEVCCLLLIQLACDFAHSPALRCMSEKAKLIFRINRQFYSVHLQVSNMGARGPSGEQPDVICLQARP